MQGLHVNICVMLWGVESYLLMIEASACMNTYTPSDDIAIE